MNQLRWVSFWIGLILTIPHAHAGDVKAKPSPLPKACSKTEDVDKTHHKHQKKSNSKPLPAYLEGVELELLGIALFGGTDVVSSVIRGVTKSQWSHVGILLRNNNIASHDRSGWYCFEATGTAEEIVIDHTRPHVQINPWMQALEKYDGRVAVRILTFESSAPRCEKVLTVVKKFHGVPYERHPFQMLKAVNQENHKEDLTSVFCSELVAQCLQELGILNKEKLSDNYLPKDFSSEATLELTEAMLENEVVVREDSKSCTLL